MKILQIHNRFDIEGGIEVFADEEYEVLSRELTVERLIFHNEEELNTPLKRIISPFKIWYSWSAYRRVSHAIRRFQPDLIHLHNIFPFITTSVLDAAEAQAVPVIFTLHDFRLIYPNATLYAHGKIDRRTIEGSIFRTVKDKVYHDSYFKTAYMAALFEFHRQSETWIKKIRQFVAPSRQVKSTFVEAGFPDQRITVIPNFSMCHYATKPATIENRSHYTFLGRVTPEKGIEFLLDCWAKPENGARHLKIIGDGTFKERLQKEYAHCSNISWTGFENHRNVFSHLQNTKALIVPSEWYEAFGLNIIEAFSQGVPVIGSDLGTRRELIGEGENGFLYRNRDAKDFQTVLDKFEALSIETRMSMADSAYWTYLEHFTEESYLQNIMELYHSIINE